MLSPRSCPRDELTSGYVSSRQLSCAMSSSFDTPFPAVTHEKQSSSATTLAAVARAIVFAPQRSPIWFPEPMIPVSQLTSPIQFPKPEESRRTDSNSGYPKLGLVPLLTRFIGYPTNRARFATASHLVAQMPARSATLFPGGLPLEKPAEAAFPPRGCPHDE